MLGFHQTNNLLLISRGIQAYVRFCVTTDLYFCLMKLLCSSSYTWRIFWTEYKTRHSLKNCDKTHSSWLKISLTISVLNRTTGGPRYMRTFYLRSRIYAIEIMAFQRNISSYLPMLLVSLYANSLYANHFLGPYLSHITRSACILTISYRVFFKQAKFD